MCVQCAKKNSTAAPEMHEKEEWKKTPVKNKKKAAYATPVPNWHLNKNANKPPKIGFLQNANHQPTRKINKQNFKLKNTCAFDTIVQVTNKLIS